MYSGAAESFNFLLNSGEKVKKGFEDYLGEESRKFVGLEAEIRNRCKFEIHLHFKLAYVNFKQIDITEFLWLSFMRGWIFF